MGTLKVTGEYKNLEKVSEFVKAAAIEAGFPDSEVYKVTLAIDEAVTNIIDHAYGGEKRGEIKIISEINGDGITLTLIDQGHYCDLSSVPTPNFHVPLDALPLQGAGLSIIRKVMDEINFFKDSDGCNKLILRKRLRD